MTTTQERRLLSDLGELIIALEEPAAEITSDEVFVGTLERVRARCEEARDGLLKARSSYEADQVENKVVVLEFAQATSRAVEEAAAQTPEAATAAPAGAAEG